MSARKELPLSKPVEPTPDMVTLEARLTTWANELSLAIRPYLWTLKLEDQDQALAHLHGRLREIVGLAYQAGKDAQSMRNRTRCCMRRGTRRARQST